MSNEVQIEFLPEKMLVVSAKGVSKRVHCSEMKLINNHTGQLNMQGLLLLDMAAGKRIPKSKKKIISNVRKIFKDVLGIERNPFQMDWKPYFTLIDGRSKADDRARDKAIHVEYKEDIHGKIIDDTYTYDNEGDETAKWLEEHT